MGGGACREIPNASGALASRTRTRVTVPEIRGTGRRPEGRALGARRGAARASRADSLSAAFRNLAPEVEEDLSPVRRLLRPLRNGGPPQQPRPRPLERCDRGCPRQLKRAVEDALLLRCSRDFATLTKYRGVVDELVGRRNARSRKRINAERAVLRPLPPRRAEDGEEAVVTVTSSGGFMLRKVFYSVPSRRE
jgi:hypothetical protein